MKYLVLENAYQPGKQIAVLADSVLHLKELENSTCIVTKQGHQLWAREHIHVIVSMLENT